MEVSDSPGDVVLRGVIPTDQGWLVGLANNNGAAVDPTLRVRRVGFAGALGNPSEVIADHSGALDSSFLLAAGGLGLAAVVGDAKSRCAFQKLDSTGQPLGTPTPLTTDELCVALRVRDDGYDIFVDGGWSPRRLLRLDASGNLVASTPPLLTYTVGWQGEVWLDHDRFVLAWLTTDDNAVALVLQSFAASGAALASANTIVEWPNATTGFAALASSAGALAAWPDGSALLFGALSPDATVIPAATVAVVNPSPPSMAPMAEGALVGWQDLDDPAGSQGRLVFQSVSADGGLLGESTEIPIAMQVDNMFVVVGSSAFAFFTGQDAGSGIRVYGMRLACAD